MRVRQSLAGSVAWGKPITPRPGARCRHSPTRARQTPDEIWLTEHPPIYTLGLAGRPEHLHRDNGIPVLKVDRGGQITYHGPGQLIAYLLIDIGRRRLGVRQLVRAIEDSVIQLLDSYGIAATVRGGAPGVYVQRRDAEAKIAALGLKIRNGRSYHGLALNIDMDLAPFADIDPCGYRGLAVTQLRDLGIDAPRAEIESRLTQICAAEGIAADADGLKALARAADGSMREAQGGGQDRAHPHQDRARRAIEEAGMDRVRAPSSPRFHEIKRILREHKLHTVCEEASCPNIGECFGKGTATFMIMGDICTRRCPFCDVGHGRPLPLDADEPANLAATIAALKLAYVVITSVDRDDLRDGGAQRFVDCIRAVRERSPATRIRCWCPTFAAGSSARWTSWRRRRPT